MLYSFLMSALHRLGPERERSKTESMDANWGSPLATFRFSSDILGSTTSLVGVVTESSF